MIEQMRRNREAILNAARSANWKTKRAIQCVDKRLAGEQRVYDKRNIFNLAALTIDLRDVPVDRKEEYFDAEVEKIIDAYEGKTDIKPYIEKLYNTIAVSYDIDWSDERQVENLLVSVQTNQALSTMTSDFPKASIELYKTKEDVRRIDNIVCRSDVMSSKLCGMMMQLDFRNELNTLISVGLTEGSYYSSITTRVEEEVTEAVLNATEAGNNTVMLDATVNDLAKDFFFGRTIDTLNPNNGFPYTQNQYAKDYLTALEFAQRHSAIEQMTVTAVKSGDDEADFNYGSMLRINGKSVTELRQELNRKTYREGEDADTELGKMIRNALTDGKSVVTMTRLTPSADGKMRIDHQELKVDLDKLNEIDRKETKYNFFRRFLDRVGIWKIQRFPTNAEREAKQLKVKNSPEYQKSMRALENDVFKFYNGINPKRVGAKSIVNAIPKIERDNNVTLEKQPVEQVNTNNTERELVVGIKLEAENKVQVEPMKENTEKVLTNEIKPK